MKQHQALNDCVRRLAALSLCLVMLGACVGGSGPGFSYATQAKGNGMCEELFSQNDLHVLTGKMPILPGALPSRDMLSLNAAPNGAETAAIRTLETAVHRCKSLRAASGYPTTASEDILEARVSKLRYALYNGAIPYAVYNYGLAQALKKHAQFMVSGERALTQGRSKSTQGLLSQQLSTALNGQDGGSWTCTAKGCF